MTISQGIDKSLMVYAKVAGVLYLLIIVLGISSELLIRASLVVNGDAGATAANILASPALFRTGFATDAIMLLCDVAIAVLFYQLFKSVSKTLALMAAAFRLTQAAILGFNLLNYYTPMLLLSETGYLNDFNNGQVYGLVSLFLELHSYGYDLGLLFFGLSNIVLGYLVVKSDKFPIIFGYGLQAAGIVYLVGGFVRFLLPEYSSLVEPAYIVPFIAELSFCMWLLVKGIKVGPDLRQAET